MSFRKYPILYNPFYPEKLENERKLVFKKEVIKEAYGENYRFMKKNFESNKLAMIDVDKLKTVNLSSFGRMDQALFRVAEGIVESEWQGLWTSLIEQKIIKNDGSAGDRFNEKFDYPTCLTYAHGINYLIRRTFLAERIRHRWIQSLNDQPENDELFLFSPAINEFLLNPHKSLLADLLEAHVIFPPTVPAVEINEDKLKKHFTDKTEYQRILDYLMSNRPTYACLETPDVSLKPLEEAITYRRDLLSIATELYVFHLMGFEHTIVMNEKRWSAIMIAKCLAVIVIGLAQVIMGAVVELYSAGWMTHVATGLCSEGISDIMFGLQALISGNSFTWANYGRYKFASIAITVTAIGVGSFLSKGVSLWKYGYKTAGPGFEFGTKEVAKNVSKEWLKQTGTTVTRQVMKSTSIQVGKGVALGLANHGVEMLVREQMASACWSVGVKLSRSVSNIADKKQDTLAHLYRIHGPVEASRLVSENLRHVLEGPEGWFKKSLAWITSSFPAALTTGLSNALAKRRNAGAAWAAAETASTVLYWFNSTLENVKFIHNLTEMASTHLSTFDKVLQECVKPNANTGNRLVHQSSHDSDEAVKEFQNKMVANIKAALDEKSSQLIQKWTIKVLKQTTTYMATLAAQQVKSLSKNAKECTELEYLRRLQSEERKRNLTTGGGQPNEVDSLQKPSEEHMKACLKLMKQTKSPAVFAEIIREGVPLDRFSADGLSVALTCVLENKYGIDIKGGIQFNIESSDGRMRYITNTSDDEQGNVIDIQMDRAVDGQSKGNFNNSSDGGGNGNNDYNYLFNAVAEKMQEQYPKVVGDLSAKILREMTAHAVETDSRISNAIRKGWQRHTIDFFSDRKGESEPVSGNLTDLPQSYSSIKTTKEGNKKMDVKDKKKEVLNAENSPSKKLVEVAQQEKVRDLKKENAPCTRLKKSDKTIAQNYLFKTMVDEIEFYKHIRRLMRNGKRMEAVWKVINVQYIEKLKWLNETDPYMIKKQINKAREYLEWCHFKEIIDQDQITQLNDCLIKKVEQLVAQNIERSVKSQPSIRTYAEATLMQLN